MKSFINFLPPWVETNIQPAFYDKESGTVIQQTARMYAKVNQLVRHFNCLAKETKETVDEYIAKFVELKDFVDDYFDNLDVQEEINNKLDAMAEAGTLQEIIGDYLNANAVWGFDNVADMKASTNLIEGSFAHTLGYYAKNDGGCATYKIRKVTNDDTVDEAFLVEIGDPEDELVAELVVENEINIKQLGARPQAIDGTKYDIASYVTKYISFLNLGHEVSLYIPSGVWHSTPLTIHRSNGFNIHGDEQFILHNNRGTIVTSLIDNQDTIWTIGNRVAFTSNFVLKNICFTSAEYEWDSTTKTFAESSIKNIVDVCLRINGCQFGDTDNLYFEHINGSALALASCWEINYRKLFFRDVNALAGGVIKMEHYISALSTGGVNASQFENMMFEQALGDLINCQGQCKWQNCVINNLNFEDYKINRTGVVYTTIDDNNRATVESDATKFSIIKVAKTDNDTSQAHNITINNIQLNNVACWFSTINGVDYVYDRIVSVIGQYTLVQFAINNLDILGMYKDITSLYSHDNIDQGSAFTINNIYNRTSFKFKFDVQNFPYIKCDKRLNITVGYQQRLNNSITPCYEVVANRTTGNRYLNSDSDCINELGLAVKMFNQSTPVRFTVANQELYIRAKIPNGETYKVSIQGSHTQVESLVGTGSYAIYHITLGSQWNIGDYIQFNPASDNTGTSMFIDYFIN